MGFFSTSSWRWWLPLVLTSLNTNNRASSSFVVVTTISNFQRTGAKHSTSIPPRRPYYHTESECSWMSAASEDGGMVANISNKRKASSDNNSHLSIAILGGGISGLSCASQLLTRHKQLMCSNPRLQYKQLEVTVFDTGRLRPGGRCSSRLPDDAELLPSTTTSSRPAIVKADHGNGSNRRACDRDDDSTSVGIDMENSNARTQVPMNIQKAINNNGKSFATTMGPVDHAAQILSIPSSSSHSSFYDEFQTQLKSWLERGIIEEFPFGSVCELVSIDTTNSNGNTDEHGHDASAKSKSILSSVSGKEMYYGKGGMGSIPIAMREYCQSFNNDDNEWSSFRIMQDLWVSPSNGVKYIGAIDSNDDDVGNAGHHNNGNKVDDLRWELWGGKKSLGKYHRLVIAHNGKCGELRRYITCQEMNLVQSESSPPSVNATILTFLSLADRIMSRTPAKAFHSLLRTQFAPYVPQWGGNQMTLNSIYSLVFAVKSAKGSDGNVGNSSKLISPIAKALSKLSSSSSSSTSNNSIYTILIKNEPNLCLLSSNTLKHHHAQNQNSDSIIEVYTLLSSAKFGKQFKGPQENLPPEMVTTVVMKLLGSLERSLEMRDGTVVDSVIDLKLQLWGAAVPLNTWTSTNIGSTGNGDGGTDGFVYDAAHRVGACGDWILDPSVAGAWESGRRLANWLLVDDGGGNRQMVSVGLPDRSTKRGSGKFVPSLTALGTGIGTVPTCSTLDYVFPKPTNNGSKAIGKTDSDKSRSYRRQNGAGSNRRGVTETSGPGQPVSR